MTGKTFKRVFFDIETSPNLVFSWNVGYDVKLDYDNIIQERAIICICYKYEGESKVHHLTWNKGNDEVMIKKFATVLNEADEVIGHNSDRFDIKWVRTRCLKYGVPIKPQIKSIDTLKEARGKFRFNSNRLDYIAKYLGIGSKIKTEFSLWKDIVLYNDTKALDKMVKYCKQDVLLLEEIFIKLNPYIPPKTHISLMLDRPITNCPECLSKNTVVNKHRISAAGARSVTMQCRDCGKYFSVAETKYEKALEEKKSNE